MAATRCLALAAAAVLLLASPLAVFAQAGNSAVLSSVHRQLAQDRRDLSEQLEASSTRRLLASEMTVPITASHSVTLPSVSDLPTLLSALSEIAGGSATGMFPAGAFPELNASRYGFAPTADSFCLFHVPKGGKPPVQTAAVAGYGYSSHSGFYGGGYGGYIPSSYSSGAYHFDVIDLTGRTPTPTFPYGLPTNLGNLVDMLGAELDCLLAPILPDGAPNFAVFLEVLLEDGFALMGQFIKWLQAGVLSGNAPANTEEIIYLRDPVDPWGPPLKLSFSLGSLAAAFGVDNTLIPAMAPSYSPVYEPTPYQATYTPYSPSPVTASEPGISPLAAAFATGASQGESLLAVAYDGYLDQCQVILGSIPGSDGSFDKVNDFSASINNGAWSVPLSTLLNETGDVAYVVPASRSGDYAQLTLADRATAGFCYDIATLLPMYNPLAVPIPTYIDPNTTSIAATALSTLLVFGEPFGLNQPTLKTAMGISQEVDILTLDALDATEADPESEAAMVYRQTIATGNTVTLLATLLTNDTSAYASFAVLVDQAIARAALSAAVSDASNGYNVTGPALDLTDPQVVQDIAYGARAWVSTTSDGMLPASLANTDARTIYAVSYAAANLNAATLVQPNASAIEVTAYYAEGSMVPMVEDVKDGQTSVDTFMMENSPEALQEALASTSLPGMLDASQILASATPGASSSTQSASTGSGHLSGGKIAGAVIGSVVGAALIAGLAGYALRQRSQRRAADRV